MHIITGENWSKSYSSPEAIESDLTGFKFCGEGWYETATDTLFIKPIGSNGKYQNGWEVTCWNYPNARKVLMNEIAVVMGKPVYKG